MSVHRPAIGLSSAGRHTLCMEDGEPWPCRSADDRQAADAGELDVLERIINEVDRQLPPSEWKGRLIYEGLQAIRSLRGPR